MTITLLLKHDGTKMGKTSGGAVWLDPDKTKPYDFYQYWRNIDDADVAKCLRMLTFLPLEQIEEMEKWDDSRINEAKTILATELTSMVHGEEEAAKAKAGAEALFSGVSVDTESAQLPTETLDESDFGEDGTIDILQLLVRAGLAATRSEARRNVQQGGVTVDGEKMTDFKKTFTKEELQKGMLVRRGKKAFKKVIL